MLPIRKKTSHTNYRFCLPLSKLSKLSAGLFILGFISGYISAHFLEDYLYGTVVSLFQDTINQLPYVSLDRNEIFLLSLKDHIVFFCLLLFFSLTNVWRLYYIACMVYTGFSQGLFFCFCTLTYGIGGILQYICFLLPQSLLLVPVYLYAINHLEVLHHGWFASEIHEYKSSFPFLSTQKRQLLFRQLPFFFLCIALLLFCAVLEGYLNVPIIKAYNLGLK